MIRPSPDRVRGRGTGSQTAQSSRKRKERMLHAGSPKYRESWF